MKRLLIASTIFLSACLSDETVSAYGAAGKTWVLQEIDGKSFSSRATLTFPTPKQIAGEAPCNAYSAPFDAPYPWFEIGQIASTKRTCAYQSDEDRYLSTLRAMTLAEVSGAVLVLSDANGREMVFSSDG